MDASSLIMERDLLDESIAGRVRLVSHRLILAAVLGLVYGSFAGWAWPLSWFVLYIAIQLAEQGLWAWQKNNSDRQTFARPLFLVVMALSNTVFFCLGIPAIDIYGAWGVAAYAFLVSGIVQNGLIAAMASRSAFLAVYIPGSVFIAAVPLIAFVEGAGSVVSLALSACALAAIAAFWRNWHTSGQIRKAELKARLRAEAGDAAKTRFLAMVSHDLRTPLTAVRAGAERLARRDNGDAAEDARLIEDAAAMMRRLLDDLLDMFKTEAGQMTIAPMPVDPRGLVGDLVRFWEATAAEKGLSVAMEIPSDLPPWLLADPTRLRQILNNLLSNALKFTRSGGVVIKVSVIGDRMELAVIDTGSGLTEQEAGSLFKPYVQAAEGVSHGGGTGLGLAISRELARAMGGDLTLSSTKGRGSVFTLSLPCVPCAALETPHAAVVTTLTISVLVVDDHPINRKAIGLMLEAVVEQPVFAASGEDALELLAHQPFDVVLMDVNMPGLDGWETTRLLRASDGPNRMTPVIAVTGSTSEADVSTCLAAGMDGWVAKPIGAAELFEAIDRVLTAAAQRQADAA